MLRLVLCCLVSSFGCVCVCMIGIQNNIKGCKSIGKRKNTYPPIFNIYSTGKSAKKDNMTFIGFVTLFFGIIHGLGFSNYFNSILSGSATDKLLPMFEFALGIEAAQIIVVIATLILAFIFQTLFKFSKRDWILTVSAFIIGVVTPMILQSEIWQK